MKRGLNKTMISHSNMPKRMHGLFKQHHYPGSMTGSSSGLSQPELYGSLQVYPTVNIIPHAFNKYQQLMGKRIGKCIDDPINCIRIEDLPYPHVIIRPGMSQYGYDPHHIQIFVDRNNTIYDVKAATP